MNAQHDSGQAAADGGGDGERDGELDLATVGEADNVSLETSAFSLHLGENATADLLSGDLRRYSVIHCASHGWVDPLDPRRKR